MLKRTMVPASPRTSGGGEGFRETRASPVFLVIPEV